MIAKITRGHDQGGLLRYLAGRGRANEHHHPRVVGAGGGLEYATGEDLTGQRRRELAGELHGPRVTHDVEVRGGHVWHLSLSNRADDRHLTDDEWGQIAAAAVAEMGWDGIDGRAPVPWVAVAHGTSAAGHPHVHLVASLVREDGTRASNWQDRVTMSRACRRLETSHRLQPVEGRHTGRDLPAVTRPERERAHRTGLREMVRAAAAAAGNEAEFVTRLREVGVAVRPRYGTGDRSRVVGYSVAQGGSDHPVWYGGGHLDKDLRLGRLREHWAPVADQPGAWTAPRKGPSGRFHRPEPDRVQLRRSVRAAATAADNEAEFVTRLREVGVAVRPRYGTRDRCRGPVPGGRLLGRPGRQRPPGLVRRGTPRERPHPAPPA